MAAGLQLKFLPARAGISVGGSSSRAMRLSQRRCSGAIAVAAIITRASAASYQVRACCGLGKVTIALPLKRIPIGSNRDAL